MISVSFLTLFAAGKDRLLEAERRGEVGLGRSLPLRELSTDDGVTVRVYVIGPVREGERDERLAYYDIQVGL